MESLLRVSSKRGVCFSILECQNRRRHPALGITNRIPLSTSPDNWPWIPPDFPTRAGNMSGEPGTWGRVNTRRAQVAGHIPHNPHDRHVDTATVRCATLAIRPIASQCDLAFSMADSSTHQLAPSRRVAELDALRALAAINLMLFHFTHVYSVKFGYSTPLGFEWPYGKYGVQLFFMLSGLVNAMALSRIGSASEFIGRRLIRIAPAYYLVVGLNLLLLTWLPLSIQGGYRWEQVWANLTIVPNLLGYECLEPVTWTLQIEVLFYGVLAILFAGGALRNPARTLLWYMAVCIVLRGYMNVFAPQGDSEGFGFAAWATQLLLVDYMPLFAIGMMLHELRQGRSDWRWNLAGLVGAIVVFHWIDQRHHNPLVTLALTGLLAAAAWGRIPVLRTRPLLFISGISYSLYLLHNNLGCVLIYQLDQLGIPPVVCFSASLPLVILLAAAASRWIEQPLARRLRSGWDALRQRRASWRSLNRAPIATS